MDINKLVNEFRNRFRKTHPDCVKKRRSNPSLMSKSVFDASFNTCRYYYIDLIQKVELKIYEEHFYCIRISSLSVYQKYGEEIFQLFSSLLEEKGYRGVLELRYAYSSDDTNCQKVFGHEFTQFLELIKKHERLTTDLFYRFHFKDFPSHGSVRMKVSFNPFSVRIFEDRAYNQKDYICFSSVEEFDHWLMVHEKELADLKHFEKDVQKEIIKQYDHAIEHRVHNGITFESRFMGKPLLFYMHKNYYYTGELSYYTRIGDDYVHFPSFEELKENTIPLWNKYFKKHLFRQMLTNSNGGIR